MRREGIPFVGIPGGGLHGVALLNAIRNGWQLVRGTLAARRLMGRELPDAILTTGGYVSGPVVMAARLQGVPVMVFVPDIEPAQSVKAIIRSARRVVVTVADSMRYMGGAEATLQRKVKVTGYPLGERITQWDREKGRAALGLSDADRVLLVFGGSRGARSINRALMGTIGPLTEMCDVVHISGTLDWPEVKATRETLPERVQIKYHTHPYLHERMGAALAAADLVISRAGAGVLGEFPYFGLPAVLVPYPHAWRYQRVNADWLADRGAAVVVEDEDLADEMVSTVSALLAHPGRLEEMAATSRALAHPEAAHEIAKHLLELGRG